MDTLQVIWDILADSAPREHGSVTALATRRRMRDVVRVDQRWRHNRDGIVVVICNVHRVSGQVELSYQASVNALGVGARTRTVSFERLQADYQLLVSMKGLRS